MVGIETIAMGSNSILANVSVDQQRVVSITYKGNVLSNALRMGILVEDKAIVECMQGGVGI